MHHIATYQERRFDGRRTLILYSDHVLVRGKNALGAEFETPVPLDLMLPIASRLRLRPPGFLAGLGLAALAAVLFQGGAVSIHTYWGGLAGVVGVAGVALAAITARKVEWVQFTSTTGAPALAVARSGPDRASFESFVGLLVQQISAVSGVRVASET
jgi:hypothetical protein